MPRLTPSGKKTKLADFEDKVSAGSLPGGEREKFAIANKVGLLRGSKPTSQGLKAAKGLKAAPPGVKSFGERGGKASRPGTRFGVKKTRHYTGA